MNRGKTPFLMSHILCQFGMRVTFAGGVEMSRPGELVRNYSLKFWRPESNVRMIMALLENFKIKN
jgi:hypothetical protein